MGNTLANCGHLLNDLYPHIFSYLSPGELATVSLVCRQLHGQVTDEVWKELCWRDFAPETKLLRQTRTSGGSLQATGAAAAAAAAESSTGQDSDAAVATDTHSAAANGDMSYRDLYRMWRNEVLIIYHVFSSDYGAEDVASTLYTHGRIKASTPICIQSNTASRPGQAEQVKERLSSELPKYRVVMYISNGGVNGQFQTMIGDALARFVDQGGAVILFPFATATERLLGRWDELGLNPIHPDNQTSVTSKMRLDHHSGHPVLKNVHNIIASFRAILTMSAVIKGTGRATRSATTIAHYEDGSVLVAELPLDTGLVLAVNLFPPSVPQQGELGRDGGWEAKDDNDVPVLLTNAVRYAMNTVLDARRRIRLSTCMASKS